MIVAVLIVMVVVVLFLLFRRRRRVAKAKVGTGALLGALDVLKPYEGKPWKVGDDPWL